MSFRFGYTAFGVAPNYKFWHRRNVELPKWYRLLFGWFFGFIYHSGQSGQWYIFRINLGALQVWLKTRGERKDEYTGFHVAWSGLKEWKLLL